MIRQLMNLFQTKPTQTESIKPVTETQIKPIKPVTEFPAKILIIDNDNYEHYTNKTGLPKDFMLRQFFAEEIDNNLYEFYLVRDLLKALEQIRLVPPDLILCELILPPRIIEEFPEIMQEKNEIGLKIFKVLEALNLDYTIPVIFWAALGDYFTLGYRDRVLEPDLAKYQGLVQESYITTYKELAMELGAFDCIQRWSDEYHINKINQAMRKALRMPEKQISSVKDASI